MLVNKQNRIGIMQGRLTPSSGRGIQFFPFENWEREFKIASQLGLGEIEFIFDFDDYQKNPLWSTEGIERIKELINRSGVRVNYICADFFMRRPFFRVSEEAKEENVKILKQLIAATAAISAAGIEIPLVDNSSFKMQQEENIFIASIQECLPEMSNNNIRIGLETDLPPQKFSAFLGRFNNSRIKANYDSGNSAALGYDSYEEITTFGGYIANIHIKDRLLDGGTIELGTGNANFDKLFQGLKEINYSGNFILQAARGKNGEEEKTVARQIEFLKSYIEKYL